MGRGNYLPIDHRNYDYRMVYIDETDVEDFDWFFDDLRSSIKETLPPSFGPVNEWDFAGFNRSEHIIFNNNLLDIRTADNEWSMAVIVRPTAYILDGRPSQLNLAYGHLDRLAEKIFDGLIARGYKLYVRTGPWTSSLCGGRNERGISPATVGSLQPA